MRPPRLRTIVICTLAALSGGFLLSTSQQVQEAEDKLRNLQNAVEREEEAIRVFRAEWAYLNSPLRLDPLARDGLGLKPAMPGRIVTGADALPVPRRENRPRALYQNIAATEGEAAHKPVSKILLVPPRKPKVAREDFKALLDKIGREGAP